MGDRGQGEGGLTGGGDADQRVFGVEVMAGQRGDGGGGVVLGAFDGVHEGRVAAGKQGDDGVFADAESRAAFDGVQQCQTAGGTGAGVEQPAAGLQFCRDGIGEAGQIGCGGSQGALRGGFLG